MASQAPPDPPSALPAPEVTVTSGTNVLSIRCPVCDNVEMTAASAVIRGTEYICEGCGAQVELGPSTTRAKTTRMRIAGSTESGEFEFALRPDGIWVFLDKDEADVLKVLEHDSDRSVAIIVGSMIENRLQRCILGKCQRNNKVEERAFQPSGPLGSFSAKIDLAYLTGIISAEAHAELVILKDIRNLFAHNLGIRDFRSQRIKDKAKNFTFVDDLVTEFVPAPSGEKATFVDFKRGSKPVIWVRHAKARKKRARDRYLMTAQLFTVRLAAAGLKTYPLPMF